ncbi:terminase [Roseospira marina]|uniref:Terminase n=1 Tax=Roseospira marina TaxID=140057 RepID=A0A5M6I7I4_9PROT|nr:phage terminase small subunit [Roseospira marina]KAA5603795.1 terminase [Roseospira marina]MBB4316077.1 hypothetical protein [Roseospira marina]MBB5089243.1 hypothetical protein [Roseospira marina]
MATPAQIARARALARMDATRAADPGSAPASAGTSGLDVMLRRLKADLDRIRAVKSMATRGEMKAGLLPGYMPYVDGVIEADSGRQDAVVVQMMIWARDAQSWPVVLRIAGYVVRYALAMPDGFDRDAATWLVEELANAAADDPAALPHLDTALRLTADHDMHDPVRAKALKVLGLAVEDTDPGLALDRLERAYALDRGAGVKKALDRVRKAIAAEPTADPDPGSAVPE